jgi:tetratricopeptide (TPR) repeat protein
VDGIPLGIELAAAWMSTLAPQQLAEHLQADFTLLVDQRRGSLPRHQTLRAAIEWSYRLLSDPERALLRRFAIFRGAWSLAIAEAIAGEAGIQSTHQLLHMLSRLISKSLIIVDHRGEGEMWYRLLEPLREYLLTALSAEEAARVQERRLHYYAQIAEAAESGLSGDQQQQWLSRLEREHDNLRAALEWGCDHGGAPAQLAAQLAAHIWRFWLVRGHYAEGRRWLEQMLARAAPAEDVRIRLLYGAGVLARLQLDLDAAAQFAREQMQLATQVHDLRGLADGYGVLGWIEEFLGNMQQALTFFQQRLILSRQLHHQRGIAYALRGLGEVATAQGRYVEANTWLQEALHIFAELGDRRYLARIWQDLGRLAYHEHQLERAEIAFQNSLAIYHEVDDRHNMADLWLDLSRLALARDDFAVAVAHQEAADRLIQDQADRWLQAASFMNRAQIALRQRQISAARHYLEQALSLFDLLQHRVKLIEGIDLFAAVAMAEQRPVHALHLWSAAEHIRRQMGLLSPVWEARQRQQQIDALSLHMTGDHFTSIWQAGQEWSLEQAMAEARSDRVIGRS